MLALAPMQGLTGLPFRKACFRTFGPVFDYAVSPFVSLTHGNLTLADKKISDVLPQNNVGSIPVVPQILGSEIDEFIDLANRLFDVGYTEVNWNLGCPMPRVARKMRGSGLLPHPDKVRQVLDAVLAKTPVSISVKMRLGYHSDREIFDLVPVLNDFPLASVTIHPRIGTELYSGSLHIACLKKVLPLLHHKFIFNGDINTLDDYLKVKSDFPDVEGFMIGRGAISDPLLPLCIAGEKIDSPEALTVAFLQNLCREIEALHIPGKSKANKLKEYWGLMMGGVAKNRAEKEKPLYVSGFCEVRDSILGILDA